MLIGCHLVKKLPTAECGCRRCGRLGLLLSFSRKHKTHVVVCESRGLHEWITQTVLWNVNCTTLILPQVLITSQKRKKRTFDFSFRYLFLFCHFVQWLFCMLGLQTYKCCLLLPWRTTEINFTIIEEQCEHPCCFFCVCHLVCVATNRTYGEQWELNRKWQRGTSVCTQG